MSKPRKPIAELIEELRSWLPNYDHGPSPNTFRISVARRAVDYDRAARGHWVRTDAWDRLARGRFAGSRARSHPGQEGRRGPRPGVDTRGGRRTGGDETT